MREMHSACAIGKHVVVHGGRDNEGRSVSHPAYLNTNEKGMNRSPRSQTRQALTQSLELTTNSPVVVILGATRLYHRVLQDLHLLDVEKMEWEKKMVTDYPRCAHSCVAVKFQDTCVSGVVTSSEEGEEAHQEGLIIFAGFSGTQVENSVLFVPKGTFFSIQSFIRGPPKVFCEN